MRERPPHEGMIEFTKTATAQSLQAPILLEGKEQERERERQRERELKAIRSMETKRNCNDDSSSAGASGFIL